MSDMMANHISSHVPGEPGAFLINPYGMMYEEITASSLIKVDHRRQHSGRSPTSAN
jgi:ribulose-5-phosphate 4-epimerase/fuculose-1-phosphate aldolase